MSQVAMNQNVAHNLDHSGPAPCEQWNRAATLYDFFAWAGKGQDGGGRWCIQTVDGLKHTGPVRYATSDFVVIGRPLTEGEKDRGMQLVRTLIPFASIAAVDFMAET
jgi:hypothetical protein